MILHGTMILARLMLKYSHQSLNYMPKVQSTSYPEQTLSFNEWMYYISKLLDRR